MAGAAAAAAAATIISGAAAKLQSCPKSARAGSAQNPGAGAATVGSAASASSAPRTRLPRMKGAVVVWEEEERREDGEEVEKEAGVVPVPVAAMMDGSAWRSSHSMVWPSDLWPSSRVSWKTRAAQMMGMRMRRPRPSTLLWRSLEGALRTARALPLPLPLEAGTSCLSAAAPPWAGLVVIPYLPP
uniref:Uncharacterized protein n=1 Tax=Setaria italica TaxID=4555 RepID=K3YW02_SETIT